MQLFSSIFIQFLTCVVEKINISRCPHQHQKMGPVCRELSGLSGKRFSSPRANEYLYVPVHRVTAKVVLGLTDEYRCCQGNELGEIHPRR